MLSCVGVVVCVMLLMYASSSIVLLRIVMFSFSSAIVSFCFAKNAFILLISFCCSQIKIVCWLFVSSDFNACCCCLPIASAYVCDFSLLYTP